MIKLFLDTADIEEIKKYGDRVDGFTTNPTLMRKAGVIDYEKWAKKILEKTRNKPVSLEVLADDFNEMERQARKIASWGKNIYIKIPITNTKGKITIPLIENLIDDIQLNITAITTNEQIKNIPISVNSMIISYFAGRVADAGIDPILQIYNIKENLGGAQLLWASCREVINIYQADNVGVDIITITPDILEKYIKFKEMDLKELSLLTIKQFYKDGKQAKYEI